MIDNGLLLAPRELYCLGGIINAKYIDYSYIAALDDIGQDFELFKKETIASLVTKGILMEDFSGNMELDEEASQLLKPIFFGNTETSLNICTIENGLTIDVYNYHFLEGQVTLVKNQNNELFVSSVNCETILDTVKALLPKDYVIDPGQSISEIDKSKVTRFFSAKSIDVGYESIVKTFIECNGVLCTEEEEGIIGLTAEDFIKDVFDIIKGAK